MKMINAGDETRRPDDQGVAMILVLGWSVLLMALSLVVVEAVIRQIVPSNRSENSYAALAAAEAGIDDYKARVAQSPNYYLTADTGTGAFAGFVPVPGGNTTSSYTYAVDSSRAGAGGDLRVYVTGKSGDVTRTLEAALSKRSTLDYVYMSDIETTAPDLPGAYSSAPNSGGTNVTAQALAASLCSRHWYESGRVSTTTSETGNQRNLKFCQWAGIYTSETLTGKVHTNDIWRLENTSLVGTLPAIISPPTWPITSSCPSTEEGLAAGDLGCSPTHRFIATDYNGGQNNSGPDSTWSSSTSYQGDAARPASGGDSTNRNPRFDTILKLPLSPALLKKRASESGCVYTGPTRIRFAEESGLGYMYVTSPDTLQTSPACSGSADGRFLATGTTTAQKTAKIALAGFSDLVIYVQNVRRSTETDDPDNDFDISNRWAALAEPTCKTKSGTKVYPFVIPDDATDKGYFNSGSTYKGFPSEQADPASPWYGSNCSSGDLYVQGKYKAQLTIATESNVILTSSLTDSSANTTTGKPNSASQSILGLVSDKFSYIYRPFTSSDNWVGDWKTSNAQDPKLNFALLALDKCFASQDPYFGSRQGNIYLWGSIAQKYRCVVGSSGGYFKKYSYDDRLKFKTPPYMLELSEEPWRGNSRTGEVSPMRQAVGTVVTYPLVFSDDASGASVPASPVSTTGPIGVTVSGTTATVTATGPGLAVFTYNVVTTTMTEVRRLVILVE